MLTDGANFRNECYHTPSDTFEGKLNFTFMSNVVKACVAAMAELAEIQHGDWATTSFQSNVGIAPTRMLCNLYAYQEPNQTDGFLLDIQSCAFSEVLIELYDMKGTLLLQQNAILPDSGIHPVLTPKLPEGVYVLKIRHATGTQAQKIMLR